MSDKPTRFLNYRGEVEFDPATVIFTPPGWDAWQVVSQDYDFDTDRTRVGFVRISETPDE